MTFFKNNLGLIHGGDYNPEQWLDRPDILAEDIRLMKKAGINSATLGVFAWSTYEPCAGEFRAEWLLEIMGTLYQNGIYTVLATPTAARPAWLDQMYPEAMRVSSAGVRNRHGLRHNFCPSSPAFRERAAIIIRKLAGAVKGHPGLILWHINNELGGECYCEHCVRRFREFLRERYENDIGRVNHEWWTTFWSHTYNDFDQIEPPFVNGERSIHGLTLDWKRFTTANIRDYIRFEKELLLLTTLDVPVTTNFMCLYPGLDYNVLAAELDIVSWDSYPYWGNDGENLADTALETCFHHSVMRSFKRGQPFMLMESVPSQVNWHPYNKLKRPGIHRLSCLQAVGCGSDSAQYFQWRKGRGSFEQYHGAVIDHLGTDDTRVYREVAGVGGDLQKLTELAGSIVKAEAALIFDWNNRWAIEDMAGLSKNKQYEKTCMEWFKTFIRRGRTMDIVPPEADLSDYKLVIAPMLYLVSDTAAENLKRYVEMGGRLIATYLTGYVNENTLCRLGGFPGGVLAEVFGLVTEEIDALYPGDSNLVSCPAFGDFKVRDYCEVVRLRGAEVLGTYRDDYYAGTPAVTVNGYGNGKGWYVAARLDTAGLTAIVEAACADSGISALELPEGVACYMRVSDDHLFSFYLNWTQEPQDIPVYGRDMLTGQDYAGSLRLEPLGAAVIKSKRG